MAAEPDLHEEMHIAHFWSKQLGPTEYMYHNPADLRRWYHALETRGPEEVRDYLRERDNRYHTPIVTGIVPVAPHPPRTIVELWLSAHDKTRTASYWWAFAAFFLLTVYAMPNLSGCSQLHTLNTLATNPPQMQAPIEAAGFQPAPAPNSTLPNPGQPPASVASPTATPSAATIAASHP